MRRLEDIEQSLILRMIELDDSAGEDEYEQVREELAVVQFAMMRGHKRKTEEHETT